MKLLCTQPRDPMLTGLPAPGMADYLTTLQTMLASALRRVDVVVPFVDDLGAAVLAEAYDRCPRPVQWTVFVRRCPPRLLAEGRKRRWTIYEYVGGSTEGVARGFHCKVFIADDAKAVVGSANLIYTNLAENVEIGAYFDREEDVTPLLAVPRALARASRVVRY